MRGGESVNGYLKEIIIYAAFALLVVCLSPLIFTGVITAFLITSYQQLKAAPTKKITFKLSAKGATKRSRKGSQWKRVNGSRYLACFDNDCECRERQKLIESKLNKHNMCEFVDSSPHTRGFISYG